MRLFFEIYFAMGVVTALWIRIGDAEKLSIKEWGIFVIFWPPIFAGLFMQDIVAKFIDWIERVKF